MKITAIALTLSLLALFHCKEKAAASNQPVVAPTIPSGLYVSSSASDCLCVNSEKKIAGTTELQGSMGINLGDAFDKAESEDMKNALRENYRELKASGKEGVLSGQKLYVRVKQARGCAVLNNELKTPITYEEFCLKNQIFNWPKDDI